MKRILLAGLCILSCAGYSRPSTAASGGDANVLVSQKGLGAAYGSRDPYRCSSTALPKTGAIDAAMARQYIVCGTEQGDAADPFWLLENVKVEVGKGVVPKGTYYVPRADQDPNAKDYAIRGSLDRYLCSKVRPGTLSGSPGKNCALWHETNASGDCYRTTFGDWKCYFHGTGPQMANQPPPH
jgi:hypothetical protein